MSERCDRYAHFVRRSGLFASLAADLLTPSAARSSEARSLRALWDGGSGAAGAERTDAAPRLSVHLVTGLREGLAFLRSAEVADSGLLARLLVARPASRIGARSFSESDGTPPPALQALHARLTGLYAREVTCGSRIVALDEQARALWLSFAHEMEAAIAAGGTFAAIRPLAGCLAQHAVRLAAVIALIEDENLGEITPALLARGIELARFYAGEALRLSRQPGSTPAETDSLAALQSWLERKYAGGELSLRDVYCLGPAPMRFAVAALHAMRHLELLGIVEPVAVKAGRRWRVLATRTPDLQHNAA